MKKENMIEETRSFWNNPNITVIKRKGDDCRYVLDGWNGEVYTDCVICHEPDGLDCYPRDQKEVDIYHVRPIEVPDRVDDDGEPIDWKTIDYDITWARTEKNPRYEETHE